ncbi:hypothetical protein D3C80_97300 [compost metagenome]
MLSPVECLENLHNLFKRHAFRYGSEAELQEAIADLLMAACINAKREYRLDEHSRPDFLVEGGIALEVKVKGTWAEAARQCYRYQKHPEVKAVLLVSGAAWALHGIMPEIDNTPFYVVKARRAF